MEAKKGTNLEVEVPLSSVLYPVVLHDTIYSKLSIGTINKLNADLLTITYYTLNKALFAFAMYIHLVASYTLFNLGVWTQI